MNTPTEPDPIPSDVDLSGRQLGDYRVLRRLGQGAMAVVYLAEQGSLKRRVALKVLRGNLADDETYVRRFQREAEAAASLVHANIVQIHEVGCIDRVYFIAQEYVEGQNLRHWIGRNDKPDLPHALSIIRQVAAALAKAAERGIVHRDIKPENILLTRSGDVKVADFGLARLPRQGDGLDLTQVGITLGTPLYMSPEQVEGKPLDPRSDLYSFGVTCYHMLAGSPPFAGESPLSVAVQHLKKEPPPLETLRGDLPRDLCRIVHKMLAKDPKDRYQSARQLLHELRQLQTEQLGDQWPEDLPGWEAIGLETTTIGPVQATQRIQSLMETAATATPRRLIWPFAALGLLAALLIGAGLAWRLTRPAALLADAETTLPQVERQSSAQMQYVHASRLGTEAAWRAVIDNFADKENYVRRAKQQLARMYLQTGEYNRALAAFRELADLNPRQDELRAFGLAGQAIVLARQNKHDQSTALMTDLQPLRDELKDEQLLSELNPLTPPAADKAGAPPVQGAP
jgi:serine/threonine-protein kinase